MVCHPPYLTCVGAVVLALLFGNAFYNPVEKYDIQHFSEPPYLHHLILPGGRKLAYAEYGLTDGFPIFVLQSFMQARVGFSPEINALTRDRNFRIIVVDRPGYGESDSAPNGYNSLVFARDLDRLADSMNISAYGLVGISAGGVYAMACAHEISSERLKAIVLLSPAPPDPSQPLAEDSCYHPVLDPLRTLGYYIPIATRGVMNMLRWWIFFWYPDHAFPPEQMNWAFTTQELNHFVSNRVWFHYTDATLEAMKPGVDGICTDLQEIGWNWAFQVNQINTNHKHNIYIFHGHQDTIVPVGCAIHYSKSIPNVKKTELYEDCGHGMMGNVTVWEDILENIQQHV